MPTLSPACPQPPHRPAAPPSSARRGGLARVLWCPVFSAAALFLVPVAAQPVTPPSPAPLVQEQLRQGRALEALQTVDAALVLQARDASLRFLRGVALMDLQRDSQATQVFTELAEEYPELPDPWNNLALLHVRAGQPERARQALEVALRNDPSHRTARLNLGEVYLMLAAQSWQLAAQVVALEPAQLQRLEMVRELLKAGLPGR